MYISELDLHGFKSFAYKTKVKFDSGITAIVGPNGCGKSNIVDALRWVLGEQRPTLLRSSTMSNVIFNGTAGKKALGMAEVSLNLVNNKGILPTEYSEVTITRRLYRSGDSEYLINHTACRLKDIMELFMDTGMGADAYSVIELKMVEEILNDRNNDRRRLFEEAAGVTRYKEKRKQTLRKLDSTQKDLQRIEDILVEVRKKTRSLELQAEKAARAKNFRNELESLDKAYNRHEYLKIQEELEPLQVRIKNAEKEKKEIVGSLEEREEKEEKARHELVEKERQQAEAQRHVNQLESALREMETNLRITREKISHEENVIKQYAEDIKQSSQDLEELKGVRNESIQKLEDFSQNLEKSEQNLKESRERFTDVQQQYTRERHQLYELEIASSDATRELNELRTERIKLESKLENTEDDLARILKEIDELEEQIGEMNKGLAEAEKKLDSLNRKKEEQQKKIEQASAKRQELEARREEIREEIRTLKSQQDAVDSEVNLLEELARSKDTFPSGIAYLMEHHSKSFNRMQVVGNVLHTDEEHAPALEAALGEAINFLIVSSMEEAVRASDILKQQDQGRATFIPLEELRPEYDSLKHSILSVVEADDKELQPLAQLLLGSTLLAEDVPHAKRLLEMGGSAAVTHEGERITTHRFLRSGSKSEQAGVRLGLKDKIEKLLSRREDIQNELNLKDKALKKLEKQLDELDLDKIRNSFQDTEQEIRKWEQQQNRAQSGIQVYEKNIRDLKNRRQLLATNENTAKDELESLNPRQKELRETLTDYENQQQEIKQKLQKLEEERSIAQNRFNDAQLKHQDLKNKAENLERDVKRAESGIESITSRLESRQELSTQSKERISEYNRTIKETESGLKEKKQEKTDADGKLSDVEEAAAKQRGTIHEIEKELKELRQKKEVNLELLHHLTMAREKFDLQAQSLSDHIWETYGLLMKQIEREMPEDTDPESAKERIAFLRQKLNQIGEVNPLAIEEYEEERERLDFLEEQVDDLQKAESQLRETIDEINVTATERFNKTFEQIRTNFKKVFNTLFEEDDYCDLLIEEEDVEDPLEAKIEIRANPRGKRPSSINQLSGGEKTLTAIALLFAIYLVKPSPFCVLDEVDAPLDDANIERFASMIREFSKDTQFIIITHNKKTMSKAEMMYGVTMPETGVSRLVGVKLDEVTDVA
ncbi:MAG: chromosome segregation protein SMC [Balneolaceae bacterium]